MAQRRASTGGKLRDRNRERRRWRKLRDRLATRDELLEDLAVYASENGQSLTELRRHILDQLLASPLPLSAYQLIKTLKGAARSHPTTAYRAIEFLEQAGSIRRIESLNAYMPLRYGAQNGPMVVHICSICQRASQMPAPVTLAKMEALSPKSGFQSRRFVIEVYGRCQNSETCDS